jgi:hypothetical protein
MFQKLNLFPSLGEGGRHLIFWVPYEELTSITETDPVSETLFSSFYNARQLTKSKNPVNLSVILHCQNPLEFNCLQCYTM